MAEITGLLDSQSFVANCFWYDKYKLKYSGKHFYV